MEVTCINCPFGLNIKNADDLYNVIVSELGDDYLVINDVVDSL